MDHDSLDDGADVRAALHALVGSEPSHLPSGSVDIERRGRRRLVARRLTGVVAAVVVTAAAGLLTVNLTAGGPAPMAVAQSASPSASAVAPPDLLLAALAQALPETFGPDTVGADAMPINYASGGPGSATQFQLAPPDGSWVVTIQVAGDGCSATIQPADTFSAADLGTIADTACTVWKENSSLVPIEASPRP